MTLRVDPEQNELRALKKVAEWRGKHVLEIGCGEGRLTSRLAGLGAHVHASDPDPKLVRAARKNLPAKLAKLVQFSVGHAERLKHGNASFDTVVFAWAL